MVFQSTPPPQKKKNNNNNIDINNDGLENVFPFTYGCFWYLCLKKLGVHVSDRLADLLSVSLASVSQKPASRYDYVLLERCQFIRTSRKNSRCVTIVGLGGFNGSNFFRRLHPGYVLNERDYTPKN